MYIDKATIVEAQDYCGKEPPFSKGGMYDNREVALQVTLKLPNSEFRPHIYVGGRLNRQTDDGYKAWGSAWKVRAMLEELGIAPGDIMEHDEEQNTFKFTEEGLELIKGREVYKVAYYNEAGKRREYDRVVVQMEGEAETATEERIRGMFLQDVDKGFVSYSPGRANVTGGAELPFDIMLKPEEKPTKEEDLNNSEPKTGDEELPF